MIGVDSEEFGVEVLDEGRQRGEKMVGRIVHTQGTHKASETQKRGRRFQIKSDHHEPIFIVVVVGGRQTDEPMM